MCNVFVSQRGLQKKRVYLTRETATVNGRDFFKKLQKNKEKPSKVEMK